MNLAFWFGKCILLMSDKRPHPHMTFTLVSSRHFLSRSGWRNGILHRLS